VNTVVHHIQTVSVSRAPRVGCSTPPAEHSQAQSVTKMVATLESLPRTGDITLKGKTWQVKREY
jgi:hypothetical protein